MKYRICPKCGMANDRFFSACKKCYTAIDRVDVIEFPDGMSEKEVAELAKAELVAKERKRANDLAEEDGLRKKAIQESREKLEANGNLGYYEYKVVTVHDSLLGDVKVASLQEELSKCGRDGWKLVSSIFKQKGQNTVVGGVTSGDIVLIFEKYIPFD